jgi:amidohydrolase
MPTRNWALKRSTPPRRVASLEGVRGGRGAHPIGKTGVVAVVHGRASRASGRMIGLRADMDALPMTEHNDFAWKSDKHGLMHGCGHDGHTAMLVGAARYLAETRQFDGTAVLIFQPGEEGFAGAKRHDPTTACSSAFRSIRSMPCTTGPMRPGTVGINPGPMMAAADRITIEITGRAGTAHMPTSRWTRCWWPRTSSPRCKASWRAMCARSTAPSSACVPCMPANWARFSVIPGEATLVGTVRTFSPVVQAQVEKRLNELCARWRWALAPRPRVHYERITRHHQHADRGRICGRRGASVGGG